MLAESESLTYSPNMTAAPTLDMTTLPPFVSAVEGRLMMALKFFELGRLSLGQAAKVAGYSKRAFSAERRETKVLLSVDWFYTTDSARPTRVSGIQNAVYRTGSQLIHF